MDRPGPSRREVVSSVLALCSGGRRSPAVASAGELRFGLTPVFLTSDLELLDRLRSYLEQATGFPVRLVTRRTYQEITSLLLSGQLDAAWICGFPFVANRPRLALVAVPVWQGKPLYRSYLITGTGSGGDGSSTTCGATSTPSRIRTATPAGSSPRRPSPGRARPRNGSSAARSSPTGTATSSGPWPPGSR